MCRGAGNHTRIKGEREVSKCGGAFMSIRFVLAAYGDVESKGRVMRSETMRIVTIPFPSCEEMAFECLMRSPGLYHNMTLHL